ncbi:Asp-tRNA(Asn)/Glu-tRNA(Gln) amidotransferase GatCAB subunit A [Roseibium alexandrii]|uniref:Indoleacetamide hydrolase n=1 Tax=Roseibium alexandrii (strain DSM 17067 / NCIMB 14079 / DFL-11) TaxID=244592 RepID=A0A5E8H633_ROSAD|nr:Asp-tRNA(Asn)/Glu-tRNA(Gln) amidotransferase GatCAB subunit A [Roseibium alexandrii]EEE46838.1 Asp-tRNAAsn/Glu-tRNAGln amidotransferase A subunit [Roseibium alexandrii DFL-11]
MSDTIAFQDIRSLKALMDAGEITPGELVAMFAGRISRYNGVSRAFITVTEDAAAAEAASLSREDLAKSPIAGIPYACKDLFDVKDVLTTAGSRVFHDRIAAEDAYAVACLRNAGALNLGKTNLHEFAYGATGENEVYGTCVNAYDTTRLAGGSSSGSAAAIAFGLVPAALGTDTGGSVRAPAVLNGLVGLKPTIGRVPTSGIVPYCWTLDHVGLMTRTIADCADILGLVAGHDPQDPASVNLPGENYPEALGQDISGLRIGIPANFFFERSDPEILETLERVKAFLVAQGAELVPITFPDMEHTRTVSLTVQLPEALSAHSAHLQERGELYGKDFRAGLALGQCLLAEHYVKAKRFIERYRQQTTALFDDVDLILTPATPEIAQKIGTVMVTRDGVDEAIGNAITRFTTFFNMTGHPALTMPCGLHSEGLPIGLQLVGRYFDEKSLFRVAHVIEQHDAFSIPLPKVDS